MKTRWPADRPERRLVADLVPYAKNARTHSKEQIAEIARSIQEWGWTTPVLIDEVGGIIAGHGRVMAAKELGILEVPVLVASEWTETQKRAYVLADNKLALNAGWDTDLLRVEIADLQALNFDLGLIGFSMDEVGVLLADKNAGLTDPDETPDAPSHPVSELGDVWVLGNHRIICGDSCDALVVDKLLGPVKPHLMVTDPPYGVEYDADWRNKVVMVKGEKPGQHGSRAVGKVLNDDKADWRDAWALFLGDVAYVWCAPGPLQCTVFESLNAASLEARQQIIWAKSQFAIGRGNYHYQHETCWYAVRKNKTAHYTGDRKQTTLWKIDKPQKSETGHSTQKPVECMKRPIENNSSPGQAVYEPFSGSGTTIIAGEMTGRHIFAIELNPAYVDVAATRWAAFAGKPPILEETGETFAEVLARRQPGATIKAVPAPTKQTKRAKAASA
jgi:DNA modification methylase